MSLTKHQEGSMRELWSIALPLMLSSFSVVCMLFVDRLLLAHYSTQALNAVVTAATVGWAFWLGWMVMASIAEVFVAQYNGANQKEKLGEPVWQMIWLSLLSFAFFIPLALWGGTWFFGSSPEKAMERDYFSWMMIFGPSCAVYSALTAFFIGQGKPGIITIIAIIANLINALLDVVLIFGIEGIVPSLGIMGAAIATCSSSVIQMAILGFVFLSKKNRQECGTGAFHLKLDTLWQCIKVGFPNALFVVIELAAWAVFYVMMTAVSEEHITIAGIGQSLVILFFFFAEGMSKAVATVVGNLIGAKKFHLINQVILSGVKLHLGFFVVMCVGCIVWFDTIVAQFLPHASPQTVEAIRYGLFFCLVGNTVYLFFEGVRMVFSGALTAAGDTLFLLIAGSTSIWLCLVIPIYFFVVKTAAAIEVAIFICVAYSIAICIVYFGRYLQGTWRELSIIS